MKERLMNLAVTVSAIALQRFSNVLSERGHCWTSWWSHSTSVRTYLREPLYMAAGTDSPWPHGTNRGPKMKKLSCFAAALFSIGAGITCLSAHGYYFPG